MLLLMMMLVSLIYKTLNTGQSPYLRSLLQYCIATRTLRSAEQDSIFSNSLASAQTLVKELLPT